MSLSSLRKMLVIDEEAIGLMFRTRYEKKYDTKVFIAQDESSGVEVYKTERPEITFIDITWKHARFSPVSIDGISVLRKIKAIDKEAVCVIISTVDDPEVVAETKRHGASAYILKPVSSMKVFDDVIEELLNKY